MRHIMTTATLRSRAIRLLARRERSRDELRRLLDPGGAQPDEIRTLLDTLERDGWLSDQRLAEQLVNQRRPRGSAARLRHEMARRGLRAEVISESTTRLEESDLPTAMALWRRRFGAIALGRSERERQIRFLLNRGFSRAVALKVLSAGATAEGSHDEA